MTEQQLAAMRQALEALELMVTPRGFQAQVFCKEAYDTLRTAIADAESRATEQAAAPEVRKTAQGQSAEEHSSVERGEPVACRDEMCACRGGPCASCPDGEREKELADVRDSRDFYKRRTDELQKAQSQMRDPERTMVCDILANGRLLVPAGGRYSTSPPASKPWVGLTDVEWMNIVNKDHAWFGQRPEDVAHEVANLVEAKLREKNTGETK